MNTSARPSYAIRDERQSPVIADQPPLGLTLIAIGDLAAAIESLGAHGDINSRAVRLLRRHADGLGALLNMLAWQQRVAP